MTEARSKAAAASARGRVRLDAFRNSWYNPGRPAPIRLLWMVVNRLFFLTNLPWPYWVKRTLLTCFGARVGNGVVIKTRVNIKYPWHLVIGEYSWIGEGAWIDSLGDVTIGAHVCLSQGAMIETGNHDWS